MPLNDFFDKFRISSEKEDLQTVITNIDNGVVFRGTNLWVLIFAIFVASLGLNVNSTALNIGAMLISPLMGPIMGIGLGMGINDIVLLRKAIYNFAIASGVALGLLSAIVDNVPLVAASQGMYDLSVYPTDHPFWEFLALTTGTGGSAIIIGSAAGVAVMGIEQIDFMWYLKKISWLALVGFAAGILVFLLQQQLAG